MHSQANPERLLANANGGGKVKYCEPCQLEHSDVSRFCKACGKLLVDRNGAAGVGDPCPACGSLVQKDWKFCKQCGHAFAGQRVSNRQFAPNQPSFLVAAPVAHEAPPREEECSTCGHRNRPAAQTCESCGAAVGAQLRKVRLKKVAIGVTAGLIVLIFATVAAAGGWYALGIPVIVQTDPGASKVVIDGNEIGVTNEYGSLTTSRIRAGDHSLTVIHDGYDEWTQSFNVSFTDWTRHLNVKLNLTKFKLIISSSPAASEILVDNNSMGTTDDANGILETAPLAPGEHSVTVRHDGYRDWKQNVTLKQDQKLEVALSSAPVFESNSSSADLEVRNTLEGWAQATRNRDLDSHMRYYADTLDYYYNRTQVPSTKIRDDRTRAFAKFNYLDVRLSNINVQLDSTGQRATVLLDKTFDFRGDYNASYNGSVQDQLTLTKLGGGWLITGEKELKVYYVNK